MTIITYYKNGITKNRLFMTISLAAILAVSVPMLMGIDYSTAEPTVEKPYFKFWV